MTIAGRNLWKRSDPRKKYLRRLFCFIAMTSPDPSDIMSINGIDQYCITHFWYNTRNIINLMLHTLFLRSLAD